MAAPQSGGRKGAGVNCRSTHYEVLRTQRASRGDPCSLGRGHCIRPGALSTTALSTGTEARYHAAARRKPATEDRAAEQNRRTGHGATRSGSATSNETGEQNETAKQNEKWFQVTR
jgi:hypothetical protein